MNHLYQSIFSLCRGTHPEVQIQGSLLAWDRSGLVYQSTEMPIIARSLLKPWQFLACNWRGEDPFWTVAFSSHSGELDHIEALDKLAEAVGCGEHELKINESYPMSEAMAYAMRFNGAPARKFCHPCAGKHLVLMGACRRDSLPLTGYFEPSHPIQKRVQALVEEECGVHLAPLVDSCGVPTFLIPNHGWARMWSRLAASKDDNFLRLKALWTKNGLLAGGQSRLDTKIIEQGSGFIVAKEGADGLLLIQSTQSDGRGCLIKVASGYQVNHLALATRSLLDHLQWQGPYEKVRAWLAENYGTQGSQLFVPAVT